MATRLDRFRCQHRAAYTSYPLGLPTLYFLVDRAHFLTSFSEESYSPYFWAKRYTMLPHMIGGTAALLLGAVQVWLGLTGRTGVLHRRVGWAYVWSVGIGTVGAIHMSSVVPGHFAYASGLFFNAIVWAIATAVAVWAMHHRNVELHRDWMLRSYVLALAFTVARVMLPLFRAFVEVPPIRSPTTSRPRPRGPAGSCRCSCSRSTSRGGCCARPDGSRAGRSRAEIASSGSYGPEQERRAVSPVDWSDKNLLTAAGATPEDGGARSYICSRRAVD